VSRKTGRPSKFTEALFQSICDRLAQGEPLAAICRDEGMPGRRTVYEWEEANPELSAHIARAREEGFDVIAADCLAIANTQEPGVTQKMERNADGVLVVTEQKVEDMISHRRLKIETRLKLLAKWDPKRYGDKVQHADADGNKLPAPAVTVTLVKQRP
jgi:hypothetical protein